MKPSQNSKLWHTLGMRNLTEWGEKRGEVVMTMVGEIMVKLKSSVHIPKSIIYRSVARSLDIKVMSRKRLSLQRGRVAIDAVGCMDMQSVMNWRDFVLSCERWREGCTRARTRCRYDAIGFGRTMRSYRQETRKPREYGLQYVDITINGKFARVMVDTCAEANIMTETATTMLGLNYNPSYAQLRTVNAPSTPVNGVRMK